MSDEQPLCAYWMRRAHDSDDERDRLKAELSDSIHAREAMRAELEEKNKLIQLLKEVKLQRGCQCEYDYRCGGCDAILKIQNILQGIKDESTS